MMALHTVVSGGQTGVDRAALDAAMQASFAVGGWCPKGRRALDGKVPAIYPLTETPSRSYRQRTEWNVRDSDGTLVLYRPPMGRGTALTVRLCDALSRPCLVVRLEEGRGMCAQCRVIRRWLARHEIGVLNVAGPRDAGDGRVYGQARALLQALLKSIAASP